MSNEQRHILVNTRPASLCHEKWKEGSPLGNGIMGAMVECGIRFERMTINRHDLWNWRITKELPDVHETLPQMRTAIDRGDYKAAGEMLADALHEKGYNANDLDTISCLSVPVPLGLLKLDIGQGASFFHYRRALDMQHGVLNISYELEEKNAQGAFVRNAYEREAFVSCTDDVAVYRIAAPTGLCQLKVELDLVPVNNLEIMRGNQARAQRMYAELESTKECFVKDGLLYYGYKFDGGRQTGAVVQVLAENGTVEYGETDISVRGATEIVILLKSFVGTHEDFAPTAAALQALPGYAELKARHSEAFAQKYISCDLQLAAEEDPGLAMSTEELLDEAYDGVMSPAFTEKMWRYGRYLFISGTSPQTNPFPLYGLWACDYDLPWPQHVANENVQLIYWHINVGGLADYGRSLVHYWYKKIPQMQENARKLFGCRGIFVSAYSTPIDGAVAPAVAVITNWISGAGWMCRHFYDCYRYTGDEELLKNEILPLMLETAAFYEDYLCYDEKGMVKIYPSVSPENTPGNLNDPSLVVLAHANPVVKNSTMDFAVLKEVLTNLLEVCGSHGLYAEKLPVWQAILDKIPPYMINADGAAKEWMTEDLDDYYFHRHISHIYPVFPGEEISEKSDPVVYRAFEKAVDLRDLDGQVAWTMPHMAAIYSRYGRSEDALRLLDMMPKSVLLNNLMVIGGDWRYVGVTVEEDPLWAPIQLDGLLGYVNALQEMLFRCQNGKLYILPACPARWNTGEVSDFRYPGGKAAFRWDLTKKELHITVTVQRGERPVLVLPAGFENAVVEWNESPVHVCCGEIKQS